MIWLHPKSVVLMGAELAGVKGVTVSRTAKNVLEEWTDGGPYAAFVDATGVSVEIVIEREAVQGSVDLAGDISPGDQGDLVMIASPSGGSAHSEHVTARVVVVAVKHTLHGGSGPVQRVVCRGVSVDGAVAPIAVVVGDEGKK